MVGTFILSIDFGTELSFPFKIVTKSYGDELIFIEGLIDSNFKYITWKCFEKLSIQITNCDPYCEGLKIALYINVIGPGIASTGYEVDSTFGLS